jgi:PIN domain nuclease of toxin-antitoxin system
LAAGTSLRQGRGLVSTVGMEKAIGVGPLAISAISLWEIAWLVKHGRIETALGVDLFVKRCASYVEVLPITEAIAVRSVEFPKSYPADPQNRIIGATAAVEGRPLLTRDRLIVKSGLAWPLLGRAAVDSL